MLTHQAPLDSSPAVPCDTTDATLVQQKPPENEDNRRVNARPLLGTAQETDDPIGFRGIFFRYVPSGSLREVEEH